jgi:cupin 2 domain-containing protein
LVVIETGNLFAGLASNANEERFDTFLARSGARIERIVSTGQATPAGEWLQQDATEWVALLSGSASLRFEDEAAPRALKPGDWIAIPGGARHRVESTDAHAPTVWLAVHLDR